MVATRLANGQSSAWAPLRISTAAQFVEPESAAATPKPLIFPIGINGRLSTPGEQDQYPIRGVKDTTVRVRSRTRSLRSRALLQMQLLKSDGVKVAETKVADTDEWSFDFKFPDDGEYQLQVKDLLGRGGDGFGYSVEITPAGTFSIALKADPKAREQHVIENGHGACVIDLHIERFGYDGPITLSLAPDNQPSHGESNATVADQQSTMLRIVNPLIPSKAKEAKVYLAAAADWKTESLSALRLVARAQDNPEIQSTVTSAQLHRVKHPHVPFPAAWNDGVVLLSGTDAVDSYFSLQPASKLQFARPLKTHTATLKLSRIDERFKGAVTLLSHQLPAGWRAAVKAEQDNYTATFTRAGADPAAPATASLLVFAEFNGRGRMETVELPIEWIDPVKVSLESPGPLVAGKKNTIVAHIDRAGDDRQPVTIRFNKYPQGVTGPESVQVAADAQQATIELDVAANVGSDPIHLAFSAASKYQGQDFSITGESLSLSIVSSPSRLEAYPANVALVGQNARRQIVITGYDKSESPRDWTRDVTFASANNDVAEVRSAVVYPKANGETEITVALGENTLQIPVRVSGMEVAARTAFESDVLVALSKQGCNSGACHGSPSGKGMFRLSLRAFDRELDELTLIREDFGRRVNRIEPDKSLLLLKPLMKVSHGGGKKLHKHDPAYAILRAWIAEGAHADPPDTARCVRLELFPHQKRILSLAAGGQQLAVLAHFSDGSVRDVTHLAAYQSSNTDVATVDSQGLVTPAGRGEAAILVRYLEHMEAVPIMFIEQIRDFNWAAPAPNNYIDQLVNAKLQQLQYLPSATCSDAEFLRRVYLDVIGILPTVQESKSFLADRSADKRARLIDDLLQRDEFAKFWALKWGDLLKMTGKLVGDEGVYKYHRWVEAAFRENMPYDQFARSLIAASGSTFANPPANFYRTATDMNECVETVSQVFLGARLQCAKCHNHPFERWTQDNYYGLGAFFNRLQRRKTQRPGELFVWTAATGEVTQPRTGQQMKPWLPAAGDVEIGEGDRRDALVDWLVRPDNPYFAKIEANRIWSQCFARGIVDPIDDFRDSNPPSNGPLLDALAKDFAEHSFDRRHVLRTILNSRTYQASYEANDFNRDDAIYFSHQRPRLLGAEQLLDAVNHVTGLQQTLGNLPAGTKATHLPAPDLVNVDFLKVFGQPERSTVCACERADDSNLGMAIELFNGPTIHNKLRDSKNRFRSAIAAGESTETVLREMYLAAVCRPPSEVELQAALEHCRKREQVADGLEDVCWALLNTDEFLFQH
jgi:hypothetical protein